MRRFLTATVTSFALLATAAAAPPTDAPSSEPTETRYELVRTRIDGPASFHLSVGHSPDSGEPFGAAVALRTGRDGSVESGYGFFASSFGRQTQPTVSSGGTSINACEVAGQCLPVVQTLGSSSLIGYADDGVEGYNRVYVEFENARITRVDFDGDGWQLRAGDEVFDAAHVGSDDAQLVDVAVAGTTGVGVLTRAELVGPAGGSIAFSLPPCSTKQGLPIGVGSVTLRGGTEDASTSCDQTQLHSVLPATAHTEDATTWLVEGIAAGDTTFKDVPLVAFALPHCSTRIPGVPGRAPADVLAGTGCAG